MSQPRRIKRAEQLAPPSRYELLVRLAAGGMGAVYVGRPSSGDVLDGFVAVKRAHSHLLEDATFREMFVAEARLASRIRHPNVVGVRDVDESDGELLLVMDYIEGASLAELLSATSRQGRRLPGAVGVRIVLDAALGLHAAHSARDDSGRSLGIVHRDVSPHNVLVGVDGISRIVDFGVAKAIDHEGTNTQSGVLKGKAAYMAPEYLNGRRASPRSDVFSLGIVAWEGLASRRLFRGEDELETMHKILDPEPATRLSEVVPIDAELDAIVARALEKDRLKRYASAREFAEALELAARELDLVATPAEVGALVDSLIGDQLTATRDLLQQSIEASGERRVGRWREAETATLAEAPGPDSMAQTITGMPPTLDLATAVNRRQALTAMAPTIRSADPVATPDGSQRPSFHRTMQMPVTTGSPPGSVAAGGAQVARGPGTIPIAVFDGGGSPQASFVPGLVSSASDPPLFRPTPAQLHRAPTLRMPSQGSLAAMPVPMPPTKRSTTGFWLAGGGLAAALITALVVIRAHGSARAMVGEPVGAPSIVAPPTVEAPATAQEDPPIDAASASSRAASSTAPPLSVGAPATAIAPSGIPSANTGASPSARPGGGRPPSSGDRGDGLGGFKPKKNPYGP